MTPPTLHNDRTYLSISTSLNPNTLASTLNDEIKPLKLQYVGPVGELEGEHIFEVESKDGALAPDSNEWLEVRDGTVAGVRGVEGVTAVQALVARQRAKREEL